MKKTYHFLLCQNRASKENFKKTLDKVLTPSLEESNTVPSLKKSNPNDFAEMERRKKDYTTRPPFNLWYKRSDQRPEQWTRMRQLRIRQMESKMAASTTKILHTN
jgi:hypothetical protein